ncbi:MAG TPA: pilus assembly protein TadG-related protein [Candidatus Dormibacteraeota bacterium]|nr:pilus assembly protein TadG-related protein [Candidatus Dormibacteraeota bacterium]
MQRPQPRFQRGQAIVLIAIMLAVLVGMAALAIDGSRAYALRRDLQDAVDAGALAAGDTLQQTAIPGVCLLGSCYAQAESAATASFAKNLFLYAAPGCAPAYGTPPAGGLNVTCAYSDGTVLTQNVSARGPAGGQFVLTATRTLQLQFARILTNGATPRLKASATGSVNNLLYSPALAALSQNGCGGAAGTAISISGFGTTDVQGDIVSSGAISVTSGSLSVAGDIYARCQSTVPGAVSTNCYPIDTPTPCTWPNVAGVTKSGYHFTDPNYPPPLVANGSQVVPGGFPATGTNVELTAGVYALDPVFSNNHGPVPGSDAGQQCWFLSGGVYKWAGGLTNDGDFMSNELKPPDEPFYNNNTLVLPPRRQFWNTNSVHCAGSFQISAVAGSAIPLGTWAVEVTSTRTDTYAGTTYTRESAPSYCQTVSVGATQVIKVNISNVPGAKSYNVYMSPPPNGCAGPFGLAGRIPVVGTPQNDSTLSCPNFTVGGPCSLGNESQLFDSTILSAWMPNSMALPGVIGAYPPDSETAPLGSRQVNQNPDRGTTPRGDRANENQCAAIGGAVATCPSQVTPGAVSFYIPGGSPLICLVDTNNGDNFIFSGYQYNWIAVYEPGLANPPANFCANLLDASSNSAYVGLLYTPTASISLPTRVAFRTEATGGIIADTISISGQLPLVVFSPAYAPVPPAAKLVS